MAGEFLEDYPGHDVNHVMVGFLGVLQESVFHLPTDSIKTTFSSQFDGKA